MENRGNLAEQLYPDQSPKIGSQENKLKLVKGKKELSENEKRIELFEEIEKDAKELYGKIPYHNFDHASEALEAGYAIIAKCQASNIEVDSDAIRYALLFHDAGYHENHEEKGFKTKEEYSAYLLQQSLRKRGVAEPTIKKAMNCIVGTSVHADFQEKDKSKNEKKDNDVYECYVCGKNEVLSVGDKMRCSDCKGKMSSKEKWSIEQKVVRAADLSGLTGEYDYFLENAKKLKEEYEMLSGNKISWEDWKSTTEKILESFLRPEIELTECYRDEDGGSVFHKKARENLSRFMAEENE